jgi:ABC-type branched-subunit amino acid transport system substrate-binding protein
MMGSRQSGIRFIPALAGLVLSSLILGACAPSAPPPKPVQPAPAPEPAPAPVVEAPTPPPETGKAGTQVGLLLPLSGQQAGLGRAMLQAAEMGLFDVAAADFDLLPRDTAALRPDGAVASAVTAKADIILGPLFGADIKMAAPPATAARVPMVSFSNDVSAAQPGVYVLGVTPEAQVERVVAYAAAQGLKRFAIMAPNSGFGRAVLGAYQESVVRHGGTISQITFYDPQSADISIPARETGAAYKRQPFDALMIPEGGQRLRAIAAMLPAFDVPPGVVRLLGTALWQDGGTLNEGALAGGWFAATPPDRWQNFAQRYAALYGSQPDPRAGIVYDAVTLAVALAQSRPGGDFSTARLTDPSGFAGVTGVFRLLPDGRTERSLAVLEVVPGGFTVKDPAANSFAATIN